MARVKTPKTKLTGRALYESKFRLSRGNLLLISIFSLFNVVFTLIGWDRYMLFAAFAPFYMTLEAMFLCGRLPAEYYEGSMLDYLFLDTSYLVTWVVISLVIVAIYFTCWFLSKKKKAGWLIAAAVLFALDTVYMLLMLFSGRDMILGLLYHGWAIYSLISGAVAVRKLKALPPEEAEGEKTDGEEGVDFFPEKISLGNGKEIEKIGVNYYRGAEAVGGMLHFYNDRMIFKSHAINIQTGDTSIRYADMVNTGKYKNLFFPNGMTVTTADGVVHKFVVWNRDSIIAYLDRQILRCKNQENKENE